MDVVAVFHAQAVAVGEIFFPEDDAFDILDVFGIRFGGEFSFDADVGLGREWQAGVEADVTRGFAVIGQGNGLAAFEAVAQDEAIADMTGRYAVSDVDMWVFAEAHDLPAVGVHRAIETLVADAVAVAEEAGVAGVEAVPIRLLPFGDEQGLARDPGVSGAVEFGVAAVLPVGELIAVA